MSFPSNEISAINFHLYVNNSTKTKRISRLLFNRHYFSRFSNTLYTRYKWKRKCGLKILPELDEATAAAAVILKNAAEAKFWLLCWSMSWAFRRRGPILPSYPTLLEPLSVLQLLLVLLRPFEQRPLPLSMAFTLKFNDDTGVFGVAEARVICADGCCLGVVTDCWVWWSIVVCDRYIEEISAGSVL